jgi:hypothetical protein
MNNLPTLQQHLATLPSLSPDEKDQFARQLGHDMSQLPPAEQLAQLTLIRRQVEQILSEL